MWTASARECQLQCRDPEGRNKRYRLDSGISDDQNHETVFNCEENETTHSSRLSCDNKTFKLVPRTIYVVEECEADDPDQIELTSLKKMKGAEIHASLDKNRRKRKTYCNQ